MSGGAGAALGEMVSDGRGYAELKTELEGIQAIIMDESGKYLFLQYNNVRYKQKGTIRLMRKKIH